MVSSCHNDLVSVNVHGYRLSVYGGLVSVSVHGDEASVGAHNDGASGHDG